MEENKVIVEARNLSRTYGKGEAETLALDGVDLVVREGEFLSIMGPSGCGKSTLLYLIGGLETPSSGSVEVLGKDIFSLSDKERSRIRASEIGFVFQFFNLVQNLNVEENILLPLVMAGEKVSAHRKELEEILSLLGLEGKRKAMPPTLSGGQQQRVAIARAVISRPRLILADEPTGNLDSVSGKQVMELFRTINEKLGISILMVTHSEEIASWGKRIVRMSDGRIVADYTKA